VSAISAAWPRHIRRKTAITTSKSAIENQALSDTGLGRKRPQKYSKKTSKKSKKNLDAKRNVFYILQNVKVILNTAGNKTGRSNRW
jgi:hypothetical protein